MSKSSPPSFPQSPSQTLWWLFLTRGSIALGGSVLILLMGGMWWVRGFIQKELSPLAQKSLTSTLNRPINLGAVKGFSLTGVQFAASSIPPTPTDPDKITIQAVDVSFNPWDLVVNRQIKLDVTLINPDIYIEQDNQQRWISTTIAPPGEPGIIKTDLSKLSVRNARLVLVPNQKPESAGSNGRLPVPVTFLGLYGRVQLFTNNQTNSSQNNIEQIKFDLTGKNQSGGDISLEGNIDTKSTVSGDVNLKTKELYIADIVGLVPAALSVKSGKINSDLKIQLTPEDPILVYGNASLEGISWQLPQTPQMFSNTQGNIKFQGTGIEIDNLVSNYGKIPLVAKGSIDQKRGFNLTGVVNAVSASQALETLKIKSPVPISGVLKANLQFLGDISQPVLLGQISNVKNAQIDRLDFERVSGKFELTTRTPQIAFKDIQVVSSLGGELTGAGKITLGQIPEVSMNLNAKNLDGDALSRVYSQRNNADFQIGKLSATANISGKTSNLQTFLKWQAPQATYPLTGETVINPNNSIDFPNVTVNINGNIIQASGNYNLQKWQAIAQANNIKLANFESLLKNQPENNLDNINLTDAELNGKLIVSGTSDNLKITNIRPEQLNVNIAGGRIGLAGMELNNNKFTAHLVTENLRVAKIIKQSPPILNYPLEGKLTIVGDTENINLKTLNASGKAKLQIDNGRINLQEIRVSDGNYQAKVAIANVPIQKLASMPPELKGGLGGQLNIAGSLENLQSENIQINGVAEINIAGGKITASGIKISKGAYQAIVSGYGVKLNRINKQLSGEIGGKFQLAGILGSAKLADVRAAGEIEFNPIRRELNSPIVAGVYWSGQQLNIAQLKGSNFHAKGYILANAQQPGMPELGEMKISLQAQDYDFQQLPFSVPLKLRGKADFQGEITGKITTPNLVGRLGLKNLQVEKFSFEPLLDGNINLVKGQDLSLDLSGKTDRLAANLKTNNINNPSGRFLFKLQQMSVEGNSDGEKLAIEANNLPLEKLNFNLPDNPIIGKGSIAGLLTGNLQINYRNLASRGNIEIIKPQLARIKGHLFKTEFKYNNNITTITNGQFVSGESRYLFDGSFQQTRQGPELRSKISISQSKIENLLTLAQIFELQDLGRGLKFPQYGRAADLKTNPVGGVNLSLQETIQQFGQINEIIAAKIEKRSQSQPIPDLKDIKGTFGGDIDVNLSARTGLALKFKLAGENFTWGRPTDPDGFYKVEKILAEGNLERGILSLNPLRIQEENQLLSFTGNIGGATQSGKLEVKNIPTEILNRFVKLPVGINGNINVDAGIAGSLANPQAMGVLTITEAQLNKKPIESANASFRYSNSRLTFDSQILASGREPVEISGDIPYKLPFASVVPNSNITLDVRVKNQGLGLLNLFTDQVSFENGEGEVNLAIRGTQRKPIVKGIASLRNATFLVPNLVGKLTDVSGQAEFDFDRVSLNNVQGLFSKGKIEVAGEIPIFTSKNIQINNPLSVKLEQLLLNIKGLYKGNASGNLVITGSALQPLIGGDIALSNGQVLLTESQTANSSQTDDRIGDPPYQNNLSPLLPIPTKQVKPINQNNSGPMRFQNLQITLGQGMQIASPPVFNFLSTGKLNINGELNNLIPTGTIRLFRGGVNLFTTQFNLIRNYEHTATFTKFKPRIPELDVKLFAKVLDGIKTTDLTREISTGLSKLETIRIEARVKGYADKLNDNLEIKSIPSRSQMEIISLLGGLGSEFVDNQTGGDTTFGLINIAGSAVANYLQLGFSFVRDAIGLSELRVFPTVLSQKPQSNRTNSSFINSTLTNSTVELALEAGVDIFDKFSFSTIKIITTEDPLQWGFNYRLNDSLRLRGSSNFTDDTRGVIEFERRF
ncbi:translocation/assembly module TamB [Cylindrospermopsis raciborskii]|uniref:translocation/assembly module TamB n=1 Tax=Cylindrospermopsis raciborskii TaxID=77022 RepID=UPI002119DB61|nr:translocation/assembly module TamB [Cylindrospermopsis raciborskii]